MCTTVIVGKRASATGRVILGHNEDSGGRVMHQQFWCPGGRHAPGELVEGEPGRARVPQAPETLGTYWSNMLAMPPGSSFDQGLANEAGVVMCSNGGGTSFEGERSDEEAGLVDGGIGFLLRRCVMERAKSAREAVRIAAALLDKWGYWSPARNYSFADRDEAWLMNVVKGHFYVARRVPDDEVVLISNYLAIRRVDVSDTENVVASPGLVEHAIETGRYVPAKDGDWSDFDFSKAYQDEANRTDPNKSIRMRTGWQAFTGVVFPDKLNYPEHLKPLHLMTPEDVEAVLRLSAEETYRNRGDGRADCFHASAEDISRSHTRESWVADLGETPLLTVLWRCTSYQDTGAYVPWFPIAGRIPEGYQWMTLEEARRIHFHAPAAQLDLDYGRSFFRYAVLGELVNFNRGLMAGVWRVRDGLEKDFRRDAAAVREEAARLPEAQAKRLLGDFTAAAAARSDEAYGELLALLDAAEAEARPGEISVADESAEARIVIRTTSEIDADEIDPDTVLWSLGFTGAKASVLTPARPLRSERTDEGLELVFRAHDVARFAIAGCLEDTYVRGFAGARRFVAMAPVKFVA